MKTTARFFHTPVKITAVCKRALCHEVREPSPTVLKASAKPSHHLWALTVTAPSVLHIQKFTPRTFLLLKQLYIGDGRCFSDPVCCVIVRTVARRRWAKSSLVVSPRDMFIHGTGCSALCFWLYAVRVDPYCYGPQWLKLQSLFL